MRSVTMPDGTVVEAVPDDVSDEMVASDYAKYSVKKAAPTGFEKLPKMLGRVVQGAGFGAAESAAITSGALSGAGLGAAITPLVGGGLPGGIVGGLIGGAAGYLASSELEKYEPQTFASKEERAAFEGAKTFGGGAAGAGVVRGIARRAPEVFTNPFFKGIAERNAAEYYATELASSGYAGVAGGLSEGLDPGNQVARFFAEIGAGTFNTPQAFNLARTSSVGEKTTGVARRMLGSFSRSAQEARAAETVTKALEASGENIPELVSKLEKPLPTGIPSPTAAQQTGSPTLTALEASLAKSSANYAEGIKVQARAASEAYEGRIRALERTGDPQALREAAELKKRKYEDALEAQIATVAERATLTASKIPPMESSDVARTAAGQVISREALAALKAAREYESRLYQIAELGKPMPSAGTQPVPAGGATSSKTVTRIYVPVVNLRKNLLRIVSEKGAFGEGEGVSLTGKEARVLGISPDDFERYRAGEETEAYITTRVVPDEFVSPGEPMAVKDLVKARGLFLNKARQAAAADDLQGAREYSLLAEGALNDLETIDLPGYREARAFSRALNDSYRRSFAAALRKVDRSGAEYLSPETLVQKAFGIANDQTALRLSQVEDAVGLMARQYENAVLEGRPDADDLAAYADMSIRGVNSVMEAERDIYRIAAKQTMKADGRVDPARLTKFIDQNSLVLERLGLTDTLKDAVTAENAFRSVMDRQSAINRAIQNQAAFSTVLKNENPTIAIASALSSGTPKGLVRISRLVKNNREASDGLKSSIYQYAYEKAGGVSNFSPDRYVQALFGPMGHRQPSIIATLRNQGIVTTKEIKNLLSLTKSMQRITKAGQQKETLENVLTESALDEFMASAAGAHLGAKVAPRGPASLVVGGRAASFMRNIMNKMPAAASRAILEEATKDAKLMALLLKKTNTMSPKEAHAHAKALNAYLAAAGLNYMQAENAEELRQNEPTEDEEAQFTANKDGTSRTLLDRLMQGSPAVPSTRGVPGASAQGAPAPAPAMGGAPSPTAQGAPPAAGPANSQSRAMLQSLFPGDQFLEGLIPPPGAAPQPAPEEEQQPAQ